MKAANGDQGFSMVSQPEKPQHYTYLKEFRTQQCPLFLQHKCTQHRPYTCFNWHFANQRRRRPMRKRDGTFNYTPDTYCSKYDETTGQCNNGEECSLLHRNSGDTERRYHVRYYKTASCVHETDSKGVCTKNGAHCAFAHGSADLRNPTYDMREMQAMERGESPIDGAAIEMSTSMEKERILNDDPKWNDSQYVLANYKTEPCKRPPRLCRQGYACPQYHNSKDRRRNPHAYKYRSTPCPQVKQHDEWGDPAVCEQGDDCQYCHTRTEQQFYPEIYKSTKCKDMVQTGYCPRGPFCAFAHVDQEINSSKETAQQESPRQPSSLASFIPPTLQESASKEEHNGVVTHGHNNIGSVSNNRAKKSPIGQHHQPHNPLPVSTYQEQMGHNGVSQASPRPMAPNRSLSSSFTEQQANAPLSMPEPIGKGRSLSMSEYQRSNSLSSSRNGGTLANSFTGSNEYGRMRQLSGDLMSSSNTSSGLLDSGIGGFHSAFPSSNYPNNMSPFATPFFPACDTVESVIGNAMEDLHLGDYHHHHQNLSYLDDINDHDRGDTASVCSSISAGLASSYMSNSFSLPMSIPDRIHSSGAGNLSQSPPASPISTLPMGIPGQRSSTGNRFSNLGNDLNPLISPRSQQPAIGSATSNVSSSLFSGSNGGLLMNGTPSNGGNSYDDVQKLREELAMCRNKLSKWEEGVSQARVACDAWKREAEEANRKYMMSEEERTITTRQRDEALTHASQIKKELEYFMASNSKLNMLVNQTGRDLPNIPINQLAVVQKQLYLEMEQIQQLVAKKKHTGECIACQEIVTQPARSMLPCNHFALCESCAHEAHVCPMCRISASNKYVGNGNNNITAAGKSVISS